jgi:lipopolysaccharide biosynthesis glycosyltransferase
MLKAYIGWDPRDALAYEVCVRSLTEEASIPITITPLKDWELRQKGVYWRPYFVDRIGQMYDEVRMEPFTTAFSFTRYLVPHLSKYSDEWVLFCDPDILWRGDVANLLDLVDDSKSVMCVKHDHKPKERVKMNKMIQTTYEFKNWSSVMMINPSKCVGLRLYEVNNWDKSLLHSFTWLEDKEKMIGELPEEWNWLEGFSDPEIDPAVVHYTRGTPDFPGYEDSQYADEWRKYTYGIHVGHL